MSFPITKMQKYLAKESEYFIASAQNLFCYNPSKATAPNEASDAASSPPFTGFESLF